MDDDAVQGLYSNGQTGDIWKDIGNNWNNFWSGLSKGWNDFWTAFPGEAGSVINELSGKNEEHQWAQTDADIAFERTRQLQNETFAYNSAEAQKNRDFQELMSNTAYQRAVNDMKAAGLNPAAVGASGASTPSGSTASANVLSAPQASTGGYSGNGVLGLLGNIVMMALTKGLAAKTGNSAMQALAKGSSVSKAVGEVARSEMVSAADMQAELFEEAKRLRHRFNFEHDYPMDW